MSEAGDKRKFKHKLAGTIDWKEYAMYLMHGQVDAETREKEFCWESRYWYDAEKKINKELGLTEDQQEYISQQYLDWLDEQGKL